MAEPAPSTPTFGTALRFWWQLGWISFGGPAGQIALMHAELVERRRWIEERLFLHALDFCMLLPGPEAQQLATYLGWRMHGTRGALAAGILFVLPSAILLWILAWVYAEHGSVPWVAAVFAGLAPVVVAIVAHAVLRIGKRALRRPLAWCIAAAAFVALHFFHAPFPALVAAAALVGWIASALAPGSLEPASHAPAASAPHGPAEAQPAHAPGASSPQAPQPSSASPAPSIGLSATDAESPIQPDRAGWRRAARIAAVALVLWWAPVAVLALVFGAGSTFVAEGLFFSKAALVTFGGAYAVLPYVATMAVERFGWLSPAAMLDGLALAETTPGPLIMVVQFVGFQGGWNQPEGLPPWLGGLVGAAITTWVTFVPCFLWILVGAPWIERLRGRPALAGALAAVTAAGVGVVLELASWFARHTLLAGDGDDPRAVDVPGLVAAALAFLVLARWRVGAHFVVAGGALFGLARHALS